MVLKTALRILIHEKEKFGGAVAGVALAIFLMLLQWGFYLGYKRDTTVVLDCVDADLWIVPKNQPMFDGWMAMDDLPYYRALEHPDIAHTSRLAWGWASCRIPGTGGKDTVEVLGFEFESGVRLKLDTPRTDLADLLEPDGNVLIGRKDRRKLGVRTLGEDGMEIQGRRATPVGFVNDVHLFTTAGFVLTDLANARAFLRLPESHTTYVVCKCRPGADVNRVVRDLQAAVPEHDVFSGAQFHEKAATYWATGTGIGPVFLLSAMLAVLVGFLIVMLAFYVSTVEKIPVFACLKALGASDVEVVTILGWQLLVVFVLGCLVAGLSLYGAVTILSRTTISIVLTRPLVITGVGITAFCSAASALISVRKLVSTDPGEAFRT